MLHDSGTLGCELRVFVDDELRDAQVYGSRAAALHAATLRREQLRQQGG
jgi:hypothetical protein